LFLIIISLLLLLWPKLPIATAAFYMFAFVPMCVRFETELFSMRNWTLGLMKQIKNKNFYFANFCKTP
jgi:hypothetical protein